MIEVVRIEDFVIEQLFRPYMPSLKELCHKYDVKFKGEVAQQKSIENDMRKHPELIICFLNALPETKQRVFNRLRKFGGIKWYRYLDMSNPVIQWVNENLEELNEFI